MTAISTERTRRLSLAMLGALAILAQAPAALAQQDARSVAPALVPLAGLEAPKSQLQVDVWANRADGNYLPEESLQLYVRTNQDAWITVLATDSMGRTTVIFPNAYSNKLAIAGNSVTAIPGPGDQWKLTIKEPLGTNMIKVLATTAAIDPLKGIAADQNTGPFRSLTESPDRIARSVAVVMEENSGTSWAMSDLFFTVVRDRGDAAAASGAEFKLDLTLDKQSYRVGDMVSLRLMAERDCHVTVVNVNKAQGEAVVLYPNQAVKEVALHAGETTRLPSADSPVRLAVMGPAGPQTMFAVCTDERIDLSQQFKSLNMRAVHPVLTMEQWTQISAAPRTAHTSVEYTVAP